MNENKRNGRKPKIVTESPNPFLLPRDQFAQVDLTKTGYRILTEYMKILIVLKTTKSGFTLEAILHEALTHYFETHPDGREAIKKAAILYS